MRSVFFCTSYIANEDVWNTRYKRWLDFHQKLNLGDTRLVMIDDASPYCPPETGIAIISPGESLPEDKPSIIRFPDRLGRNSLLSYPGWWRSFLHSVDLAHSIGARKIIHVESDAFILSERMLEYIHGLSEGWTTFWATSYNFPETAIQVICEDQFDAMASFKNRTPESLEGKFAEDLLPFTHVNRKMVGDRYSEFRVPLLRTGMLRSRKFNRLRFFQGDRFRARIPVDADFATQVTFDQKMPLAER